VSFLLHIFASFNLTNKKRDMLLTYFIKKRKKVSYETPKTLRIQSTTMPKEKRNFNEWASELDNRMKESIYNYSQITC